MSSQLSNAQIRQLKARAQSLKPLLRVGKAGLSAEFLKSLREALKCHEIVKVKFADFKDKKKELAPQLAESTGSFLVTLLGNVAVLYRKKTDGELSSSEAEALT